ncbi:MAG: neutral zinc metallopeptidase [Acidimicrobiales bacterium]
MVRYDKSTADQGRKYVNDQRSRVGGASGGSAGRPGKGAAIGGGGLMAVIIAVLVALFGGGGGNSANVTEAGSSADGATPGQIDITVPGFGTDSPADTVASDGAVEVVDPQADTVEYLQFLMYDIQDTWAQYFDQAGLTYRETSLTIFTDSVDTGCGPATSAVGPFYCPAPNDQTVYIDLEFFDELASPRFGAAGDFAQAYVVAHEVGHHVQNVAGISDAVRQAQAQSPDLANEYSVRLELQADCFAGVWAYSANQRVTAESGQPIIEEGDIDEGLAAASSVGDDRLQAQAGMQVNPESWTHGSSQQRVNWFTTGYRTGDPEQCDVFAAQNP